jgi:hypothetical protein
MKAPLVTTAWLACFLLLLLGVPLAVDAQENEVPDRVVWDRTPIRVLLPVGSERLVHFPEHAVRVGVPDDLPLRTLSVDGTVYWQAQAPFAPVRVIVQGLEEGSGYYLLDLEAQESAPAVPLAILRPGAERPARARGSMHRTNRPTRTSTMWRSRASPPSRCTRRPGCARRIPRSARWRCPRTRSRSCAAAPSRRCR